MPPTFMIKNDISLVEEYGSICHNNGLVIGFICGSIITSLFFIIYYF